MDVISRKKGSLTGPGLHQPLPQPQLNRSVSGRPFIFGSDLTKEMLAERDFFNIAKEWKQTLVNAGEYDQRYDARIGVFLVQRNTHGRDEGSPVDFSTGW
jgi:hypothetical protein